MAQTKLAYQPGITTGTSIYQPQYGQQQQGSTGLPTPLQAFGMSQSAAGSGLQALGTARDMALSSPYSANVLNRVFTPPGRGAQALQADRARIAEVVAGRLAQNQGAFANEAQRRGFSASMAKSLGDAQLGAGAARDVARGYADIDSAEAALKESQTTGAQDLYARLLGLGGNLSQTEAQLQFSRNFPSEMQQGQGGFGGGGSAAGGGTLGGGGVYGPGKAMYNTATMSKVPKADLQARLTMLNSVPFAQLSGAERMELMGIKNQLGL